MRTLTSLEKWTYAIGNMPFAVNEAAFGSFVVFYYTQVQGISGTLAGLAMFIAISWDAISDPIVGSWSDTVRSRWGRRHPLLLAGGIPTALLFMALFNPPDGMGEMGVFLWLLGISVLLRTFLTIYFIPYSAMGAELSHDYDERTVIAKARVTMAWLAGMALPAIAFALIFQPEGDIDGRLIDSNYWDYGVLSTVLAAATALICLWGTRTVIPRLPKARGEAYTFSLVQPIRDFRLAFRHGNFRMTVAAKLAFGMCAGVYMTLGMYLGTYFWEFSSDQMAGLVVPTAVGTLLTFVLLGPLGQRFDKPVLLGAATLIMAINAFWFIGARLFDLLPGNDSPLIYGLQLVNTCIGVISIVSLQVLSLSLLADILDEHELETELRQEGVYFAATAFVGKATTGVGVFLAGIVIDLVGLIPGSAPGEVEASVLQSLGWFTCILITVLATTAFLFTRRIRLSRADHDKVRTQLAARANPKVAPANP
jgi:GPH family glycoside/pentoside/hexuronide:cation symporter